MKLTHLKITSFAFVAIVASLFISCNKDELFEVAPSLPKAKVQVIHTSPDGPDIDFYADDTKEATLTYLANTPYLDVKEGTRNITVTIANTKASLINTAIPFTASKNYSLFVIDSAAKISTLILQDDLTPPAAGKAHVRFVHLSPNSPAFDVAIEGGNIIFPNQNFKTSSNFTPISASTVNLQLLYKGTTTIALTVPNITFVAGKIYTIYARGFETITAPKDLNLSIISNN
jgi:hypothetical protein